MKSIKEKIIVFGASGFIGRLIAKDFREDFEVVLVTTSSDFKSTGCKVLQWNTQIIGGWAKELEGAKAVINLAGKSVNCRYTEENKNAIVGSRVDATRLIMKAIKATVNPPKVWLNASSATIYESEFVRPQTELNGTLGADFSPTVCKKWEEAFYEHDLPHTIQVALRMALVLGKDGGVLPEFIKLAKQGIGGKQGSGKQKVSWIAHDDLLRALRFLVENPKQRPVNLCSPNPVTNEEFMTWVRSRAKVSYGLNLKLWMLKIGSWLKQTETELLLKSRFVYPEVLLESGFRFKNEYLPKNI